MKKIVFTFYCLILTSNCFSQQTFNVRAIDSVVLNGHVSVIKATLFSLPDNLTIEHYRNNTQGDKFVEITTKKVTVLSTVYNSDNTTKIIVQLPTLDSDTFYKVELLTATNINLFSILVKMHNEGTEPSTTHTNWMNDMLILNSNTDSDFNLYYTPDIREIQKYLRKLEENGITNYNSLSDEKKKKIKELFISAFEGLKYTNNTNIDTEKIIEFTRLILPIKQFSINQELNINEKETLIKSAYEFQELIQVIDYQSLYIFYKKHIKESFDTMIPTSINEIKILLKKAKDELIDSRKNNGCDNCYLPNFLDSDYSKLTTLVLTSVENNTIPINFQGILEREITADFGLMTSYFNQSSNWEGAPFLGISFNLSKINSDVPFRYQNLDWHDKFTINIGMTLSSIQGSNYDNLFGDFNLLLSTGYRLNNYTKINIGGMIYQNIEAVSEKQKLGITPFISLSFDIRLRKWLSGLEDSLSSLFKP